MGERFDRLKATAGRHPVLSILLGAYLALSAVELVRILLYDRPREYDAGFYAWEPVRLPEGQRQFHWTRGDTAYVLRPLWAPVVRVPLYLSHPDPPAEGTTVRLSIDEQVFHEQVFRENGWKRIDLYLPPVLDEDPWRMQPETMSIEGVAELLPVPGDEPFRESHWTLEPTPDYIRVFTDWHVPPGPPSRWFKVEVSPIFVPSDHAETSDERELGVGVGEFLWLEELPADGLVFHPWELEGDREFRWTSGRRATSPEETPGVATAEDELRGTVWVRTAASDAAARPVTTELWWDAELVATALLADTEWHAVEIAIEAGRDSGALTFIVDRVWNPMRDGGGADDRELGLAVTRPEWAQ